MYAYADQLPADAIIQDFDICIVGAGAAGIAMAQRLANSSLKVILLASGQPADRGARLKTGRRSTVAAPATSCKRLIPTSCIARA